MTPKPDAPTAQPKASNANGATPQAWYAKGLMFKCEGTTCGDCCSGKWGAGFVWVDHAELTALAEHLNIPFDRFTRSFVRQIGERYSLIEKPNHDCIFYDPEVGCTVYAARPRQCRTYPFWPEVVKTPEAWAEEAHNCPGINCGEACDLHPAEEIDRLKKLLAAKATLAQIAAHKQVAPNFYIAHNRTCNALHGLGVLAAFRAIISPNGILAI